VGYLVSLFYNKSGRLSVIEHLYESQESQEVTRP
jgi:hypothetical protein